MLLFSVLVEDTKQALKNGDKASLLALRGLQSAVKNELIAQHEESPTDELVIKILKREIKKRREAVKLYQQGGRQDLVDQENGELALLEKYLPDQMNDEDIEKVIAAVWEEMLEEQRNFGQLMKMVMSRLQGKADGSQVAALVKKKLS